MWHYHWTIAFLYLIKLFVKRSAYVARVLWAFHHFPLDFHSLNGLHFDRSTLTSWAWEERRGLSSVYSGIIFRYSVLTLVAWALALSLLLYSLRSYYESLGVFILLMEFTFWCLWAFWALDSVKQSPIMFFLFRSRCSVD